MLQEPRPYARVRGGQSANCVAASYGSSVRLGATRQPPLPLRDRRNTMSGWGDEEAAAWVRDRYRPQNWFDISTTEPLPSGLAMQARTLLNMFQMVFSPEIRRRLETGQISEDFFLTQAQLLQPVEGGRLIRLNQEVNGVLFIRTDRPVQKGEEVLLKDLEGFETFDLIDEELDCGHYSVFWTGKGWLQPFDFRSGRQKSAEFIERSRQFSSTAGIALSLGHSAAALDNLQTACELLAKARLILMNRDVLAWKSHGPVMSAVNREGRMGNIDDDFVRLFNRLTRDRNKARYKEGNTFVGPSEDEVALVVEFSDQLEASVRPKRPAAV